MMQQAKKQDAQVIRLTITERGLRQDAELAMKNEPIRALIELITNSDDAYGDSEGSIVVEIERGRAKWSMTVRDRARGMSADEIREKLLSVGGRTSGFESGQNVRGNLGRGAKDVSIFGTAQFDSIKDGRYTRCEITRSMEAKVWDERDVTDADRRGLGIKRNGTVVTVSVSSGARCPQIATLTKVLASHYQLRDIAQDPRRKLQLRTPSGLQRIEYVHPERRRVVTNKKLSLPNYPDADVSLTIWRFKERPENLGPGEPCRAPGILIKGNKAIYENTLFSSEGRPNAAWFSGEIQCPYIDHLARTYDEGEKVFVNAKNPIGIISRDRDGLQKSHPFYEELKKAVDDVLGPLVDAEDKKQRGSDVQLSAKLSHDLSQLGKELGKMFSEDTEDADIDIPKSPTGIGEQQAIQIIPSRIVAYLGETKTVTLRVSADNPVKKVQIKVSPDELVSVEGGEKHKLIEGQTTLKLTPVAIGSGTITVRAGDAIETALLEVRRERPAPPPPPDSLQFERSNYSVKPGRQKKVRLVAPEQVILDHGENVELSVKGDAIVKVGQPVRLLPNEDGYFEAIIVLEARAAHGMVNLTAYVGDTTAQATARVAKSSDSDGTEFNIQVRDQEIGPYRALIEGNTIVIMGRHPAVRKVLGKPPEFPQQDEPIGRAVIAEIVAFEITRKIVEAKYKTRDDIDAAQVYSLHQITLSRYLRKCQTLVQA
jgi:hypothetical protein